MKEEPVFPFDHPEKLKARIKAKVDAQLKEMEEKE
jgi:hypothetical protein